MALSLLDMPRNSFPNRLPVRDRYWLAGGWLINSVVTDLYGVGFVSGALDVNEVVELHIMVMF